MTSLRTVATVLVAVLAATIGAEAGVVAGVVSAVALAAPTAVALSAAEQRRLQRLADAVNAWLGSDGFRPVEAQDRGPTAGLAVAINALGAAYERRGGKLARERPWRRELVDSLVSPALLFSPTLRLQAANDSARELLGIPIDAEDISLVQAVGSAALVDAVRGVRTHGDPVVVDAEHGERDLRASVSMVGDELLLLIADRTRERRVEELRRNFVVNASHELKTPVTGIRTLSEAMAVTLERGDHERVRSLLGRLDEETDRLARLVGDLLDLRRLEERGALERGPVNVAEVVRQVVRANLDRAQEAELEVDVVAPDRAFVAAIATDVELIVKNLVGNAITYNQPGGQVEVSVVNHEGEQVLTVRDTGIGIPQHDLGRIFERFYRVDTARSRDRGGTGLGLAIVRHAVERHEGTIRVDSLLGEGTTFTVTLPIEARSGG